MQHLAFSLEPLIWARYRVLLKVCVILSPSLILLFLGKDFGWNVRFYLLLLSNSSSGLIIFSVSFVLFCFLLFLTYCMLYVLFQHLLKQAVKAPNSNTHTYTKEKLLVWHWLNISAQPIVNGSLVEQPKQKLWQASSRLVTASLDQSESYLPVADLLLSRYRLAPWQPFTRQQRTGLQSGSRTRELMAQGRLLKCRRNMAADLWNAFY